MYSGDLYEVNLRDHVIANIVRYLNGSQLRQEIEYDHCPEEVKDKILDKVADIIALR